jgi:hypothetical protein
VVTGGLLQGVCEDLPNRKWRENSRARAKSWEINGEPARNGRAAAAQSYRRPFNGVVGEEGG